VKVEPGQRVAIVGPNGAGKSTLLRLFPRLVDPRSGRVVMDGQDVRDFTLASLRSQISSVHQEPVLFGLTIRENLALASPGLTPERLDAVLERSEAAAIVKKLPEKADTVVRRRGRGFSVGERQRLAVARALARDGSIWLLDEPTSGLDASTGEELTRLLHDVTRGRTTFWITHDTATAMSLDRILLLVKGKLRYFGPPADLSSWIDGALPEVKKASLRRYFEQLKRAA
jgi:ATP-binding cassette subfamily B protein